MTKVRVIAEAIDELDREVARARRTTTTASRTGVVGACGGHGEPGDRAIGRSRGGPTTRTT
ncbi:hypothetical protein [Saccharothrix sp. Mg75]|uniref:hypothetical protein n=1 Tax=Saccharothrix sp. Mg75 TaxID=3445357 RepID=UPI003EEEE771